MFSKGCIHFIESYWAVFELQWSLVQKKISEAANLRIGSLSSNSNSWVRDNLPGARFFVPHDKNLSNIFIISWNDNWKSGFRILWLKQKLDQTFYFYPSRLGLKILNDKTRSNKRQINVNSEIFFIISLSLSFCS